MVENFRWGVIGPGRIARQFAVDMKVVEGADVYAVASLSGAEKFVHDFEVPVAYDSYEALVQDPKVDGIYIATPHSFHFENAQLCLQAGKAVLCEKPLTVNARQAQSLVKLANENQVFLMEALWTRYLPLYTEVRKLLDEEVIGEIVAMQSTFCFKSIKDKNQRWLNPELAGGTLLDLGIYPISVSQWVMGDNPVEIQSQAALGSTGVDIVLAANLKYASGAISQFTTSFIHKARNDFAIYGTKGNIILDEPFWGGKKGAVTAGARHLHLDRPFRSYGFEYEIEEAVRCIREGRLESPSMTHADSLANLQLMDTIREQVGVEYPFE